jgi:hypothetical protein
MAPFYLVLHKQETPRTGRGNFEVRFAKRHLRVCRWLTHGAYFTVL